MQYLLGGGCSWGKYFVTLLYYRLKNCAGVAQLVEQLIRNQ
jgi:hypothetical protein